MRKLVVLLLLALVCTGCSQYAKPAELTQLSEVEIAAIVDEALTRGEIANVLYLGDFWPSAYNSYTDDAGVLFRPIEGPPYTHNYVSLPIPDGADEQYAALGSRADIAAMFSSTFVSPLAERYYADIAEQYAFADGSLYLNNSVAVIPLSLIVWQHMPLDILEQTGEHLTVELAGTYMLTGHEAVLPLTLTKQGDNWLLDESFSPIEYTEEDYYYNEAELADIISDVMSRVELANRAYSADSFYTIENTMQGEYGKRTALIDPDNQGDSIYAYLAEKFQTTDDVKKCFADAFIPEVAQKYIYNRFDASGGVAAYVDRADGLAVCPEVYYPPITIINWHLDNYTIWQNSETQIILIACTDFYEEQEYFALRLQNDGNRWLCDETYAPDSKYSWVLN